MEVAYHETFVSKKTEHYLSALLNKGIAAKQSKSASKAALGQVGCLT